jgi:hypothetical protein
MKSRIIFVSLLAFCCLSCTVTLNRQRPLGERVRISMRDGVPDYAEAELLAINDSVIYCEDQFGIACEPWNRVQSMRVLAYSSHNSLRWVAWMPTLALGIGWFASTRGGESIDALLLTSVSGLIMYTTAGRRVSNRGPKRTSFRETRHEIISQFKFSPVYRAVNFHPDRQDRAPLGGPE